MDGNNSTDCVQQDDQEVIELIFGGIRLSGPNPNILSSRWASSSSTSTPYLIFNLSKYVDPQRSDAHLRASRQEKQNITMYICTYNTPYVCVCTCRYRYTGLAGLALDDYVRQRRPRRIAKVEVETFADCEMMELPK